MGGEWKGVNGEWEKKGKKEAVKWTGAVGSVLFGSFGPVCVCVWFGGRWVAPDGMSGACEVSAHALRRAVRMLVVRVLWCTSF